MLTIHHLHVQPMDDGGMGSLSLYPNGLVTDGRVFGQTISELEFEDADGVTVSAALYRDTLGQLYGLELWKVDFSPLQRLPDSFE